MAAFAIAFFKMVLQPYFCSTPEGSVCPLPSLVFGEVGAMVTLEVKLDFEMLLLVAAEAAAAAAAPAGSFRLAAPLGGMAVATLLRAKAAGLPPPPAARSAASAAVTPVGSTLTPDDEIMSEHLSGCWGAG